MKRYVSFSRTSVRVVLWVALMVLLFLTATLSTARADGSSSATDNDDHKHIKEDTNTTSALLSDSSEKLKLNEASSLLPFVLVTGANGLVGSDLVLELLKRGHRVRATVRDPENPTKTSNLKSFPNADTLLEFVAFDLKERDPQVYNSLVQDGVEWIFHAAAPFVDFKAQPDAAEKIGDSVRSIRLLLEVAHATSSVTQFVYTGSDAAVLAGHPHYPIDSEESHIFTEEDWSNLTVPKDVTDYDKMKTHTEQAAWEYVENNPVHFRFTSLLPTFILGPMASDDVRTSARVVYETMMGTYPGVIDIYTPLVDIRDVVEAHIRAAAQFDENIKKGAGRRRFLLTRMDGADIFLPELAEILKEHFGPMGYKFSTWKIPKWLVWILSLFDSELAYFYRILGLQDLYSNAQSREVLGITYHTNATEIILDTAHSMIQKGLIPKTEGYHTRGHSWSDEL